MVAAIPAAAGGAATGETLFQSGSREPVPLRGVPLRGETGLRLVVADNPPFVLDVDTESVTPVPGIPAMERGVLWVVGASGAAVVVAESVQRHADLYAVRGHGARVSSLGTGAAVAPAPDGRAVWVKSFVDGSHCTLRQVGLDGRRLRGPRAFPCGTTIDPGGGLGLVANRTRVLDPRTGRTVLTTRWGILAAAGDKLVLSGPGRQLTLLDAETGAQRRLPWPSVLPRIDQPAVEPRGRLVALGFANPWTGSGQALDVWLLDTETGKLTQLPGMPALVSLKFTSMAWTDDGRLVLLAQSNKRDIVVVWQTGRQRLALKSVQLPERGDSGSDSFALLR